MQIKKRGRDGAVVLLCLVLLLFTPVMAVAVIGLGATAVVLKKKEQF